MTGLVCQDRYVADSDVRDLLSSAQPDDDCLRQIETEATETQPH